MIDVDELIYAAGMFTILLAQIAIVIMLMRSSRGDE